MCMRPEAKESTISRSRVPTSNKSNRTMHLVWVSYQHIPRASQGNANGHKNHNRVLLYEGKVVSILKKNVTYHINRLKEKIQRSPQQMQKKNLVPFNILSDIFSHCIILQNPNLAFSYITNSYLKSNPVQYLFQAYRFTSYEALRTFFIF